MSIYYSLQFKLFEKVEVLYFYFIRAYKHVISLDTQILPHT